MGKTEFLQQPQTDVCLMYYWFPSETCSILFFFCTSMKDSKDLKEILDAKRCTTPLWQTWLQFTITLILMSSKRAILCFSAASCLLWVVLPLLAASVHLFLPTSLWPSSFGLWAAEYFYLLSLLLLHSFLRFLPNIMLLFFLKNKLFKHGAKWNPTHRKRVENSTC